MKQVDKAQFVDNDFDKDMFLGNTFAHTKYTEEVLYKPRASKAQ